MGNKHSSHLTTEDYKPPSLYLEPPTKTTTKALAKVKQIFKRKPKAPLAEKEDDYDLTDEAWSLAKIPESQKSGTCSGGESGSSSPCSQRSRANSASPKVPTAPPQTPDPEAFIQKENINGKYRSDGNGCHGESCEGDRTSGVSTEDCHAEPESSDDPEKTASAKFREDGNRRYRSAHVPGLAPTVKKSRLHDAATVYNKALNHAQTDDEVASAAKNCAKCSWATAETALILQQNSQLVEFHFKEALTHFARALSAGSKVKAASWTRDLEQSYDSCVVAAMASLRFSTAGPEIRRRVASLENYAQLLDGRRPLSIARLYQDMAEVLFHGAVTSLQLDDLRASLSGLRECYRPLEEAKKWSKRVGGSAGNDVFQDTVVMESDVMMTSAAAESLQAVVTGDSLLTQLLRNSETLDMDMVYEIIDWYKQAVILAREIEVEREAIAASRLGKVYDSVLKQKEKSKFYFKHSLELAHSLSPRVFTSQDWFRAAADTLERYQRETLVHQDEKTQKERETYLQQLEDDLKKLEDGRTKHRTDDAGFLLFVYKTFPPKKESHTSPPAEAELKKMSKRELKKAFQKAILLYHPDKQEKTEEGKKWGVFCEEITKKFTNIYEAYKLG